MSRQLHIPSGEMGSPLYRSQTFEERMYANLAEHGHAWLARTLCIGLKEDDYKRLLIYLGHNCPLAKSVEEALLWILSYTKEQAENFPAQRPVQQRKDALEAQCVALMSHIPQLHWKSTHLPDDTHQRVLYWGLQGLLAEYGNELSTFESVAEEVKI